MKTYFTAFSIFFFWIAYICSRQRKLRSTACQPNVERASESERSVSTAVQQIVLSRWSNQDRPHYPDGQAEVRGLSKPTIFIREGNSMLYSALCPLHQRTSDPDSLTTSLSWDLESGMAHCFWCGWGGRLARPLKGKIHPDFLPSIFKVLPKT